jgi:hypothetical protein
VGVRAAGEFAALVVGHALIWAMHLSLSACHLVREGLFIDEVLLIQRVSMCLGDHPQPILVGFFHDGRRVSVLVVCKDGYAALHTNVACTETISFESCHHTNLQAPSSLPKTMQITLAQAL